MQNAKIKMADKKLKKEFVYLALRIDILHFDVCILH